MATGNNTQCLECGGIIREADLECLHCDTEKNGDWCPRCNRMVPTGLESCPSCTSIGIAADVRIMPQPDELTVRDRFAMRVSPVFAGRFDPQLSAEHSYEYADAMMEQRKADKG